LVSLVLGCAGNSDPSSAAQQEMVERTIVKMRPDGTEDVKIEHITVEQQRQELAARELRLHPGTRAAGGNVGVTEEALATVDSGCAGSSMWIFDNTNNTVGTLPFNHEICFYKSSAAFPVCTDLRQYVRQCVEFRGHLTCGDWANDNGNFIGSFWAGTDQGMFLDARGAVDEGFAPNFRENNAQPNLASAVYLCFPNN
jgi:hypothetical protein